MTGQPRANRDDRTSLLIGVGMAALMIIGVASVFGDAIAAGFAPTDSTVGRPAASGGMATDAGGSKS